VNYAISRGTKNILTFNEPDLSSQANMSPHQAANTYLKYVQPFAGRVNLGGPAVTESPNGTQVCTSISFTEIPGLKFDSGWLTSYLFAPTAPSTSFLCISTAPLMTSATINDTSSKSTT
jgi:hypothetical protein